MLSNMNLFFHDRLASMSNSVVYGISVWRFENVAILNSLESSDQAMVCQVGRLEMLEAMRAVLYDRTHPIYMRF